MRNTDPINNYWCEPLKTKSMRKTYPINNYWCEPLKTKNMRNTDPINNYWCEPRRWRRVNSSWNLIKIRSLIAPCYFATYQNREQLKIDFNQIAVHASYMTMRVTHSQVQ